MSNNGRVWAGLESLCQIPGTREKICKMIGYEYELNINYNLLWFPKPDNYGEDIKLYEKINTLRAKNYIKLETDIVSNSISVLVSNYSLAITEAIVNLYLHRHCHMFGFLIIQPAKSCHLRQTDKQKGKTPYLLPTKVSDNGSRV